MIRALSFLVLLALMSDPCGMVRADSCGTECAIELGLKEVEQESDRDLTLLQLRGIQLHDAFATSPDTWDDEDDVNYNASNENVTTLSSCGYGSCGRFRPNATCQCTADCWVNKQCCSDFASSCGDLNPVGIDMLEAGSPSSYQPDTSSLLNASKAPLLTFYMYRAQGDESLPPLNSNMASLSGVLWYLHNEIVVYCSTEKDNKGEFGFRRFKKTRILRYKVTTRATVPLWEKGMNFGVRVAFDSAENTGAWVPSIDKQHAYDKYGYNVGCNVLGDGPFPICPSDEGRKEHFCPISYGDRAIWYSLPGECPAHNFHEKSESCKRLQPGGFCSGTPTGRGNCTWSYESAGEVNLNDLVGITRHYPSYKAFCTKGCREYINYGPHKGKGSCGIDFWDERENEKKNQERIERVDAEFKKRYPHLPSDKELPTPKCDFKKEAYYEGL